MTTGDLGDVRHSVRCRTFQKFDTFAFSIILHQSLCLMYQNFAVKHINNAWFDIYVQYIYASKFFDARTFLLCNVLKIAFSFLFEITVWSIVFWICIWSLLVYFESVDDNLSLIINCLNLFAANFNSFWVCFSIFRVFRRFSLNWRFFAAIRARSCFFYFSRTC